MPLPLPLSPVINKLEKSLADSAAHQQQAAIDQISRVQDLTLKEEDHGRSMDRDSAKHDQEMDQDREEFNQDMKFQRAKAKAVSRGNGSSS